MSRRLCRNIVKTRQSVRSLVQDSRNNLAPDTYGRQWWEEASLYVHWPYCRKRCTYCNFNKYVNPNINQQKIADCLVKETETLLDLSAVKVVKSIFFGGGTPSLAEPEVMKRIIDTVRRKTNVLPNMKVTLEANPTSTDLHKLEKFQAAGINRLSIGFQSLRDRVLNLLGRDHSSNDAKETLKLAKMIFPGQVSVDLIFGRPGQTTEDWEVELREVLEICDNHISLYQLTLERGTLLFKMYSKGEIEYPDSDVMAEMYETSVNIMKHAGFHRYEISNFARGESAESSHNKSYWAGGQYIGVGPGAHGRFVPHKNYPHMNENVPHEESLRDFFATKREARIQMLEPDPWMIEVQKYGHGTRKIMDQSRVDILQELIVTGLRTSAGIGLLPWLQFSGGVSFADIFDENEDVHNLLISGFMEMRDDVIRVSDRGLAVVDSITPYLCNAVVKYYS